MDMKKEDSLKIDKRPIFFKIYHPKVTSELRVPSHFLRHIPEEAPDKATLKCLYGGTWNVKLHSDEDGLHIKHGWEKFQKENQLEDGEFLVFRYDGAMQFTVRIFRENGLEREVKPTTMGKNQEAQIFNKGKNQKRPANFPKIIDVDSEDDTEHATPRKRVTLEKAEDLNLTPEIPYFVKLLKDYNVKKSCVLYVPKSFCDILSTSAKTAIVLRNSEGKEWKVNCISQKGCHSFSGGWKQFVTDNKLKEGDACVFQLVCINTNELKVSVFNNPPESLLKLTAKRCAAATMKRF